MLDPSKFVFKKKNFIFSVLANYLRSFSLSNMQSASLACTSHKLTLMDVYL